MKLAFLRYPDTGHVAYVVADQAVIFSSLTQEGPSSINGAEQIVSAICLHESLDWEGHTFYDVQTTLGYSSKKPGDFDVTQLTFSGDLSVRGWQSVKREDLPKAIELFDDLVSGKSPAAI